MADSNSDTKQFTKLTTTQQKTIVNQLHAGLKVRQVVLEGTASALEHYDDYIDYQDHIDY